MFGFHRDVMIHPISAKIYIQLTSKAIGGIVSYMMDNTLAVAIVSASGAVVVGLGSAMVNAFWIGRHMDSLERRLGVVEQDLKQFYRDIQQIKLKIGLE